MKISSRTPSHPVVFCRLGEATVVAGEQVTPEKRDAVCHTVAGRVAAEFRS
jgi:hypothetical protein